MFTKKLFQFGALVFSISLVGSYVYLYSRGAADPRPQLRQVEGELEVAPAIGAVDQPPVTTLNFAEPDKYIGSTKSFIVFPPSSTMPLEVQSRSTIKDNSPQGQHASENTNVVPKAGSRDVFFSSSKSAMIIDPSLAPTQSAPSIPIPSKSVQSQSGWVPPEIPPTNQPPIRK